MSKADRKAAVAAYKERKVIAGVYAVRCTPTGEVWVGRTADVSAIQNRLWFSLRHGGHTSRSLQDAWNTHGAPAFGFEVLERFEEEEELAYVREAALRERSALWRTKLNAQGA